MWEEIPENVGPGKRQPDEHSQHASPRASWATKGYCTERKPFPNTKSNDQGYCQRVQMCGFTELAALGVKEHKAN